MRCFTFCDYNFRSQYQVLYRIAVWALMIIYIFSFPVWTFRVSDGDEYNDGSIFPSYELPYMPVYVSVSLEFIAWFILWTAVVFEFGYKLETRNRYLTIVLCIVMVVGTFQTLLTLIFYAADWKPLFSLSPGRALLLILIERKYDNFLGYILNLVPKFLLLMCAVALMVIAFTSLGFQLFSPDSEEAQQYFDVFGDGLWTMLMVMNSSNWPSPIIPAVNENRLYVLYFLAFVVIVDWGMINLVLGFVYMMFRTEQEQISHRYEKNSATNIMRAFHLLDETGSGRLSFEQVDALLNEVYTYYVKTLHKPSKDERYELILQLDQHGVQSIDIEAFMNVIRICHSRALKDLRAKKSRFFRFLNVNLPGQDPQNQRRQSLGRLSVGGGAGISGKIPISEKYQRNAPRAISTGIESSCDFVTIISANHVFYLDSIRIAKELLKEEKPVDSEMPSTDPHAAGKQFVCSVLSPYLG